MRAEPHADGHVPRRASASAGRRCSAAATRSGRRRAAAPLARRTVVIALTAIVLLGGGLRLAQASDPGRFISSDERSYARIALNLAAGDGYAIPGSADPWHWAPGTPALFAAAHLLAPSADGDGSPEQFRTAFWAQALAGTALILVVFLLAAGIAGPLAGLIAAGAIATYPPLIRATGDLVSEPLGGLTLALAALALLGAWRRPSAGRLALDGGAVRRRAARARGPARALAAPRRGWVLLARAARAPGRRSRRAPRSPSSRCWSRRPGASTRRRRRGGSSPSRAAARRRSSSAPTSRATGG